jgi:hypothetical protein
MILKPLIAAIAVGISATTALVATPAHAQNVEAKLSGLHQLCEKGDR